jgi:hypothetical protein
MRSKFGVSVIALAAAVLVLSEAQSFAGRRHGCSSCGSAGGCTVAAAPSHANAAVPAQDPAPAVAAAPTQPSASVAVTTNSNTRYRASGRRGFSRR